MVRATVKASRAKARGHPRDARPPRSSPPTIDPVARVLVDVPLAHLDRPFDYLVPATMAEAAVPGAPGQGALRRPGRRRLRGRAGAPTTDHAGPAGPAAARGQRRAGAAPAVAALTGDARRPLRRHPLRRAPAGGPAPARHHREAAVAAPAPTPAVDPTPAAAAWAEHEHGRRVPAPPGRGRQPRARCGRRRPGHRLADAARPRRGRDVRRRARRAGLRARPARTSPGSTAALTAVLGEGHHVALTADVGPAAPLPRVPRRLPRGAADRRRHPRRRASRPVHDLGLVVVWDDGDDLHAEPRAPYPHTRETLLLRAEREGAGVLVGGFARTVEAEYLLRTGWARELVAARATCCGGGCRSPSPAPPTASSSATRSPAPPGSRARSTRRSAAALQQRPGAGADPPHRLRRRAWPASAAAPRPGARPAPARSRCTGPTTPPACRWCGTDADGLGVPDVRPPRPARAGARRRPHRRGAGPHLPRTPGPHLQRRPGARRRSTAQPAIVVATPGAEPVAEGGYAAVVLLDTWLLLARTDLRTDEEALRRWSNAAGLVRHPLRARRRAAAAGPAVPRPAGVRGRADLLGRLGRGRPGARRATEVWTTWLPACETPQIARRGDRRALLDMRELAAATPEELRAGCRRSSTGTRRGSTARRRGPRSCPSTCATRAWTRSSEARKAQQPARGRARAPARATPDALRCFRFMNG